MPPLITRGQRLGDTPHARDFLDRATEDTPAVRGARRSTSADRVQRFAHLFGGAPHAQIPGDAHMNTRTIAIIALAIAVIVLIILLT